MSLVTGDVVSRWVATQLGITVEIDKTAGVGWAEPDGTITIGAAFYNYTTYNMYVHLAMLPGHHLTPTFIAAFLDYPFKQAKVHRLTGLIPRKNKAGRSFAKALGATYEGCLRECLDGGDHLYIFGMLSTEAERWLTAPYQRRLRRNIREAVHGKISA